MCLNLARYFFLPFLFGSFFMAQQHFCGALNVVLPKFRPHHSREIEFRISFLPQTLVHFMCSHFCWSTHQSGQIPGVCLARKWMKMATRMKTRTRTILSAGSADWPYANVCLGHSPYKHIVGQLNRGLGCVIRPTVAPGGP